MPYLPFCAVQAAANTRHGPTSITKATKPLPNGRNSAQIIRQFIGREEGTPRWGNFFHFQLARKGIKIWKRAYWRKCLQHTHSKPTTDSNLAVDAFALFCGVFCDFLPITLRAENTSQGGPKEAYQSWLSWNILWHEPSREKGFAPWPVCVPDLGDKLPGFAPQLASAFSSHFPAIITLINLLTAGGPRNCNGSKPVWGSCWYGMENYRLDHTHWEQLPVASCMCSQQANRPNSNCNHLNLATR